MLGAAPEEIAAVGAAVRRVLEHLILRRAAAFENGEVRRETPVVLTLEDGSLVEGVVDLALRDRDGEFDGWTVIDFKTDREFEHLPDAHLRQVRLHSRAIAEATGLAVRAVLLVI